jgi:hypothetical protein
MSNGLFIQSYPAPDVQVIPTNYSGAKGGYVLAVTISVLIALMLGTTNLAKSQWLPAALAAYLIAVLLAIAFFHTFRLDIRADGIAYANLFRKERFIAFQEISTVIVFTSRWVADQAAHGFNFNMPGTIIITPKVETGKAALRIPLWLFSNPAETEVTHLLRPEEWDSDS